MPNALSTLKKTLQPTAGSSTPVRSVLRLVAADDVSLLRVIRLAIDTVRSLKLPVTHMGPFDDEKVAETGFFIAGSASALAKLKKAVESKAAKAGTPLLMSEHHVKEATP